MSENRRCKDCGNPSKKYMRCIECNKRLKKIFEEKNRSIKISIHEGNLFLLNIGLKCRETKKKCTNIICPNCRPMALIDGNYETIEYLQSKI